MLHMENISAYYCYELFLVKQDIDFLIIRYTAAAYFMHVYIIFTF